MKDNREANRLRKVKELDFKSERIDKTIQSLLKTISDLFETSIVLVTYAEEELLSFKYTYGTDAKNKKKDGSLCTKIVENNDFIFIPNLSTNPEYQSFDTKIGNIAINFFAGTPLITSDGHTVGSLCVCDAMEKKLDDYQRQQLIDFAGAIINIIEIGAEKSKYKKMQMQFNDIQAMVKAGGWEMDVASGNTFWTDTVYDIHALDRGTPTNKIDGLSFFPGDEKERLSKLIERTITFKEPYDDVFKFIDARGNHKWVRTKAVAIVDEKGNVSKLLGSIQDITDQKNYEESILNTKQELDNSKRILELSLEGASLGVWDWDLISNKVYFDERWAQLRGANYKELTMTIHDWESRVHPDDIAMAYQNINDYLSGKTDYYECIHRVRHASGKWIYILGRGRYSAWDAEGNPTRFTGTDYDITSLKEKEQSLETLILSLDAIVMELNSDMIVLEVWSSDDEKLFIPKDQIINQAIQKIIPKNIFELLLHAKMKLDQDSKSEIIEYPHPFVENVYFEAKLTQKNVGDDIVNYILVISDVSSKKNLEFAKDKITKELNSFFDVALSFLCIAGLDGYFKKINKIWLTLGHSEEKLLQTPFLEFIHPDDVKGTLDELQALARGKKTLRFENRFQKADGSYVYLEWSTSPDPNSGLLYCAATDITQRRKSEILTEIISDVRSTFIDNIQDTQEFFDYVLSLLLKLTNSEYGFIGKILEDEGKRYLKTYAITNIAWDEATRTFYDENASLGLEFRNLNSLFGEVIKTGDALITNDAKNHPKKAGVPIGHPALDSFLGVPLVHNNELLGMFGIANCPYGYKQQDIDELKPLIEVISELINTIKVRERFEEQQKLMEKSAKLASIGELAAGVGHEINNPLAIIQGQLTVVEEELIAEYNIGTKIKERFTKSFKAIERIANIVRSLKNFSRSEEIEQANFNLSDLIMETVDAFKELYTSKKIKFEQQIENNLWLYGNRGRIQQVITNLITNAIDASEAKQEILLKINLVAAQQKIILSIQDFGVGIDPRYYDKIFDTFFTTKEVNKGTGIGLSLVNSIVKEHQGEISFNSKLGEGTTFNISFPLLNYHGQAIEKSQANLIELQGMINGKILVVDDEEEIAEILKELLESLNLEVDVVFSGSEAIKKLLEAPKSYYGVISDISMPLMNGKELLKTIRSDDRLDHLKFIFITGAYDLDFDDNELFHDGLLTKPFDLSKLQELILKTKNEG
jgi:PAS domain S-box-containing protein